MATSLPTVIATSVVRGERREESEGGIFTIDFENRDVQQRFDWTTSDIDFKSGSGDRGFRGIAYCDEDILLAASDILFRCDRNFDIKTFSKNRYLDNCHEICCFEKTIFLTSPGFDSLLAYDLDAKKYIWGFHLLRQYDKWAGHTFDPTSDKGPLPVNDYKINTVYVDGSGVYFSGAQTGALLHLDKQMQVSEVCSLPAGTHNARPYRDGVLLNDTESACVRYVGRDDDSLAFKIESYKDADIDFVDVDESEILRSEFGRGLCPAGDRFVVGGSSPSTVSLYDFDARLKVASVNLSRDIRNAVHGLEIWPFDD